MFGWLLDKFRRRSATALVLVQPYTLLCEKLPRVRPGYKHAFEKFVSAAREKGAYVSCISYSDTMWLELLHLSDSVFLFMKDKGYRRLKKDREGRMLPDGALESLGRKAIVAGVGNPNSYKVVAEDLAKAFRKMGVRRILVCGGFDSECVSLFVRRMSFEMPALGILAAPRFVSSWQATSASIDSGDFSLQRKMANEGIDLELVEGDERRLLALF